MLHKLFVSAVVASFVAAFNVGTAEAVPITGEFSKTGIFEPFLCTAGVCVQSTLGAANAVDVTTMTGTPSPGVTGPITAGSATGDFLTVLDLNGDIGQMRDFSFAGTGSASFPLAPIATFEVFPNVTFALASLSIVTQSTLVLVLTGTGTFTAPGFDPTLGTFVFTGQTAGGSSFSFSASQAAAGVPDGGATLGLLGIGMLGLRYFRRRRANI
jgi:VPDSG-CTERM motif